MYITKSMNNAQRYSDNTENSGRIGMNTYNSINKSSNNDATSIISGSVKISSDYTPNYPSNQNEYTLNTSSDEASTSTISRPQSGILSSSRSLGGGLPSSRPLSGYSISNESNSSNSSGKPAWMFVLGRESMIEDVEEIKFIPKVDKEKQQKLPLNKKDRQTASVFKIPENAEPLSLIKFENVKTRGSLDSQASRRSSGNLERQILRRESNESSKTIDNVNSVNNQNIQISNQSGESVQSKTTIAVMMKQQQTIKNPLKRENSKVFRYQQMRSMIQKFIKEYGLVSYYTEDIQTFAPYSKQVNLAMYSDENLLKRDKLRSNPKIIAILDKWWLNTKKDIDTNGVEGISRNNYISLSMAIYYVLMMMNSQEDQAYISHPESPTNFNQPTLLDARKCAEEDWSNDSKGNSYITKEIFMDSIFELADLWCESVRAMEYIEFLERMFTRIYEDPNLPPLLRRHLIQETPKIRSLDTQQVKVIKKKKKKIEKPKEINWAQVKALGLSIESNKETESESSEDSLTEHEEFTISHDIIDHYNDDKSASPPKLLRSPIKPIIKKKDKKKEDKIDQIEKIESPSPIKEAKIIKLKSSELKEIAQYLWNKEALRLIMALLRQGDEYILEKTIFDRLLKKLETGFDENIQSSLFQLMKENVIPERYQSVMSRMNKLNPEQFVKILQTGLEKRKSYSDKIVLDMSEVMPEYKNINTNNNNSNREENERLSFTSTSKPVSRSSSRLSMKSMSKTETKRLLRNLQNRQLAIKMENKQKLLEERKNRPSTAPISNVSPKKKWNQWKNMVEKGIELTTDQKDEKDEESISFTDDDLSQEYDDIQDNISSLSSHNENKNDTTINEVEEEKISQHKEKDSEEDPEDEYSMFSELSSARDLGSVWSESDSETSNDNSVSKKSFKSLHVTPRKSSKKIPLEKLHLNPEHINKEGQQISEIALDEVKVFRLHQHDIAKKAVFSSSSIGNSPKRQSWVPNRPVLESATQSSASSTRSSSPSLTYSLKLAQYSTYSPHSQHSFNKKSSHSHHDSQSQSQRKQDTYISPMVKTELAALHRHSNVSLISLHRDHEAMGESKSLPVSRPTSASISVQVKQNKRPETAHYPTISTNFSHLSKAESFFNHELTTKYSSMRRP